MSVIVMPLKRSQIEANEIFQSSGEMFSARRPNKTSQLEIKIRIHSSRDSSTFDDFDSIKGAVIFAIA